MGNPTHENKESYGRQRGQEKPSSENLRQLGRHRTLCTTHDDIRKNPLRLPNVTIDEYQKVNSDIASVRLEGPLGPLPGTPAPPPPPVWAIEASPGRSDQPEF